MSAACDGRILTGAQNAAGFVPSVTRINELRLPLPPSSNRYWRVWHGRPVVSAEARAYKAAVSLIAGGALAAPLSGDLKLSVDIYAETRRRDTDNYLKVLCDSLQGALYANDNQIVEIHARRFIAPKPKHGRREGFVRVTVEPVSE